MSEEKLNFQAEVGRVLDIVVNSLYSDADIFLRELISNASDACDKLRYMGLMYPDLIADGAEFKININVEKSKNIITIADNGIGMNHDDLINNLGTIAKSGSLDFLNNLSGDVKKDSNLIGQFGVGFYSAFMVADKVEVRSRRAGEEQGWLWVSDGKGSFSISELQNVQRGTEIKLFLKKTSLEYADPMRLRQIIRQYSDHIAFPIYMDKEGSPEVVNSALALWTRNKAEITVDQYRDFYRHIAHAFDEPWLTLHYKAEGAIEYTGLLFIPEQPPFDLFQLDRKPAVKLYTNRVFISDDIPDLMPSYLRFVKGVIDTKDLPLNVSREMLQKTPVLEKVRKGLVRRLLAELKTKAKNNEDYAKFWNAMGKAFKEGIYEDTENRETIAQLSRFYSTSGNDLVSLDDYISKMKEGQNSIFYMTGENPEVMRNSPQLEGFEARGVEVLLFTDPIDEFWPQALPAYKDKKFKPVSMAGDELEKIKKSSEIEGEEVSKTDLQSLIAYMKITFGNTLKDVRTTDKLVKSPVCLVAAEGDISLNLERMMRLHQQPLARESDRILEINPRHKLISKLAEALKDDTKKSLVADAAMLLLDQALVAEGEPVKNPAAFMQRITSFMLKGI